MFGDRLADRFRELPQDRRDHLVAPDADVDRLLEQFRQRHPERGGQALERLGVAVAAAKNVLHGAAVDPGKPGQLRLCQPPLTELSANGLAPDAVFVAHGDEWRATPCARAPML